MRWKENRTTRLQLDPLLVDLNKPILVTDTNAISSNPSTPFGTQRDSNQQNPMNYEAVRSHQLFSDPDVVHRFTKMKALIESILGVPAPIKRSAANSFAYSPFVDEITLMEIPKKFNFPNMKHYNGTVDPDNHIVQYKQPMFTAKIPRDQRKVCMCKGFSSSLTGPTLQWYINLPNVSIGSFAQLTDTFVEQFGSSRKLEKQ